MLRVVLQASRREKMNSDIANARATQKTEKERRQAVAARQEMEEFERILHVQRAAEAQDHEREVHRAVFIGLFIFIYRARGTPGSIYRSIYIYL